MSIKVESVFYDGPEGPIEGQIVHDDAWSGPRPGVLVFHSAFGRSPFETGRAQALAAQGFTAFVADLYGQGVQVGSAEEGIALARRIFSNPAQASARVNAAVTTFQADPRVDADRVAAMGYCLGGKVVLDLARAGARFAGVASFHGGLMATPGRKSGEITAKVLVLHGWDDPFAPPADVAAFAQEMTAAKVDWQLHAYGQTGHGFTNAHGPQGMPGIAYSADADRRSWKALLDFLAELFPGPQA